MIRLRTHPPHPNKRGYVAYDVTYNIGLAIRSDGDSILLRDVLKLASDMANVFPNV